MQVWIFQSNFTAEFCSHMRPYYLKHRRRLLGEFDVEHFWCEMWVIKTQINCHFCMDFHKLNWFLNKLCFCAFFKRQVKSRKYKKVIIFVPHKSAKPHCVLTSSVEWVKPFWNHIFLPFYYWVKIGSHKLIKSCVFHPIGFISFILQVYRFLQKSFKKWIVSWYLRLSVSWSV